MGVLVDGSNIVGASGTLTPPSVGTLMCWLRSDVLSGTQRILGCTDNFEGRFSGATLFADWGISGGNSLTFGTMVTGTIYHIAATWNTTSGTGQTYQDGAFVASDSARNGVSGGNWSLNARGTFEPWDGAMDDARIYNRVLSAAEINDIYRLRGADGIVNGLLHRWTMNEGSAGSAVATNGVKDVVGGYDLGPVSGSPTYARGTILFRRKAVAS